MLHILEKNLDEIEKPMRITIHKFWHKSFVRKH